jgi:hypothetical protein
MFLAAHGVFLFEDSLRLHECQCTISAETADAGSMSLRETRGLSSWTLGFATPPRRIISSAPEYLIPSSPSVCRSPATAAAHRGPFGRHEQSVAPTLVMDSVRVVVGSNIDADRCLRKV